MPSCAAQNCTNRREKGVRLFRFPSDPERRQKWADKCGRESWKPTNRSVLCEIHFEKSQFELHREDGWRKLKPNAMPTLHFDDPKPPRQYNKRKRSDLEEAKKISLEEIAESLPCDVLVDDKEKSSLSPTDNKNQSKKKLSIKEVRQKNQKLEIQNKKLKKVMQVVEQQLSIFLTVEEIKNIIMGHFEPTQFEQHRADGLRKLKPNAVPTVFNFDNTSRANQRPKRLSTLQNSNINYNEDDDSDIDAKEIASEPPDSEQISATDNSVSRKTANISKLNDTQDDSDDHSAEESHKLSAHFMCNIRRNKLLRQKRFLTNKLSSTEKKLENLETSLSDFLNPDQIHYLERQRSKAAHINIQWCEETMGIARQVLKSLGPKGYDFVKNALGYPIPSHRTLQRHDSNNKDKANKEKSSATENIDASQIMTIPSSRDITALEPKTVDDKWKDTQDNLMPVIQNL